MKATQFSYWILLVAFCSGCGTIGNQDGDRKVYGGVAMDYHLATGNNPDYAHGLGIGPWWYLDMPFSFVGDTLCFPFDAYYRHQVNANQESMRRNPPDSDPLVGWKHSSDVQPDKAIVEDYHDYLQTLPPDQRKALVVNDYMVQSFEDGKGNKVVQIKIHLKQTLWKHVLFYDEAQKRTKVMKYANGHYLP